MNENDGGVTVPSVRDSTSVEGATDEIVIGNSGSEIEKQVEEGEFVGGDGEEVMVEVVGLDVFVDGVGGEEGLEREVEGCGDLGKANLASEGGIGDGDDVRSGDLKLEEVVDHSSQVWDALGENGVGNVEQVEDEESLDIGEKLSKDESDVVLDGEAKILGSEMEIDASEVNLGPVNKEAQNLEENVVGNVKKDERVVDEESLDVAEKLSKDESDLVLDGEAKKLGTEIGIYSAEVDLGPVSREVQNSTEEVSAKKLGTEIGTDSGDGKANFQDYFTSGQDAVVENEAGDLCSSKMEESWTSHTQLVSKEVCDTVVVDENFAPPEVDQSSTNELISEATDKGDTNTNAENLDPRAQVVEGEIDVMNKQGGLHLSHVAKETDPVAGNFSSSVVNQVLNVKASGGSSESHSISGVSSLDTMEPFAVGEVVRVIDSTSGPVRREVQNSAEEVSAKKLGTEIGTDSGDGEANFQDYFTSGQDAVVENEAGDLCSSKMEESLTSHTQLVSKEVCDTVVVDENFAPPEVNQSSTNELTSEATGKGDTNTNAENLDPRAQVVEGEIDVMNKQGGLYLSHVAKETDPVAGNFSSSVVNQVLNVKASGGSSESHSISGVSSLDTMEPFAVGEVVRVIDSNSSNSIGEAPNNDSLSLVDGVVGDVNTECVDRGSFVECSKVATVPSVAIDTEISVSVSPSHHADADEHLAIENKKVESSVVANIDNIEDQELKEDVGENSKVDVVIPSDDQAQYVIASEVTATESKVLNSLVEVPMASNIGSFVASSNDFENVKCEKEIIGNGDKLGAVPADPESTIEEAFADGGDDAGMDIDEVMNWEDDVPGNNTFSGTLSDLEEDTHLKLNVEKVVGSSEADLKSSNELIHTDDGSEVVLMELENTKFEVQEETNGIDVDCEPMGLDSLDLSLSELGENVMASAQLAGTGNGSAVQTDLGITEVNVLVAKGEMTVVDDKNDFNFKSLSMQEEKQEIVLQQAETHIHEVYHGQSTDLPITDEILSKEASVVVHPGKVAGGDGGNLENTVNLHVSESRDGTDGGDSTDIGSILGHKAEEGYPDGEQEREQELETQLQTTEAEILISIDDELPENEGDFSVSDLVWGKVKSHPWWPGQIFNPADASEKALKYHKKDSFLVAYFGDRTFAWNDAADLKPFTAHFSQVQKHGNSEAFRHAVICALEEVSRRVELGLACFCIPQESYDKIKFQVVENTGIKQESSIRYGADKSAALSSFEPEKLLDYVRTLAQSPYDGTDQLELVIAKAQLSSFCRYKGYPPLPEFQYSGELLESDDTLELIEANEHPASAYREDEDLVNSSSSQKRKFTMMGSVYPNKKEKNMSDLMVDSPSSTDGEDGFDDKCKSKSVSTAGKNRRAIESFPKPSFKIGECIRRAASQLTGSPSILKCSNEKFLKVDGDDNEPTGFEVSLQTPGTSPRGRMNISSDQSSVYEMLSQLHLAAQDPMKGYSFLSTIIPFFTSYRTSVVSKVRSGRPGTARKRKASNDASNTPEEFEFDDVSDSYWTDRIIQNYSEEQLLQDGQNGGVECQPVVVLERKKQVKSGRKTNSRKRYSSSKYETKAEEPAEHVDRRKQDLPTELLLNFAVGVSVPPEMNLNKTFRRFGPLMESETEVDRQGSRARVVFKKCSDAEVAYSSAGKFNLFGSKVVNYELNYSPLVSYKPLPLPTLQQAPESAT